MSCGTRHDVISNDYILGSDGIVIFTRCGNIGLYATRSHHLGWTLHYLCYRRNQLCKQYTTETLYNTLVVECASNQANVSPRAFDFGVILAVYMILLVSRAGARYALFMTVCPGLEATSEVHNTDLLFKSIGNGVQHLEIGLGWLSISCFVLLPAGAYILLPVWLRSLDIMYTLLLSSRHRLATLFTQTLHRLPDCQETVNHWFAFSTVIESILTLFVLRAFMNVWHWGDGSSRTDLGISTRLNANKTFLAAFCVANRQDTLT